MREYVENEVRKALMNEELDESMTDEGILNWLSKLVGGGQEINTGEAGISEWIKALGISR